MLKLFICAKFLLPAGGAMTITGYWHVRRCLQARTLITREV